MSLATNLAVYDLTLQLGDNLVLNELNLEFNSQGISFLLGSNGAGKTQLLKVINGLTNPTAGTVDFNISQSMLFQSPILLNRSIENNLKFILKARHIAKTEWQSRIDNALKLVDLSEQKQANAFKLSGGQQKRVAIACAYIQGADLYLLDEPTANLNLTAVSKIEEIISELLAANKKIILTTHDIVQVNRLFKDGRDEIILLKEGQLAYHSQAFDYQTILPYL